MMTLHPYRPFLVAAGLMGALGVVASAAASHSGHANLAIAGTFLLLHAPALIGLSVVGQNRIARIAGYLLLAGLALFAGDLAARDLLGSPLFPLAAPLGGFGLIAGWLLVGLAGLMARPGRD